MHSDKRLNALQNWLNEQLKLEFSDISPASSDASFRRYFRIQTNDETFIVMDAPPEHESLDEFIHADAALATLNLHAPRIHEQNHDDGFLLLEDLGTRTYLDELDEQTAEHLYSDAIDALITLQSGITSQPETQFPLYSEKLLLDEMKLFELWYLPKHLNKTLSSKQLDILHDTYKVLIDHAISQPQTWVHRDYHSRNLMITKQNNPGIIDFQDMVIGGITYDLVSLFKDCYIEWPREKVINWVKEYYEKASNKLGFINISEQALIKYFDFMGVQRHLKILGIFCRLFYRDKKAQYLNDLPLTKKYLMETCADYNELIPLLDILKNIHQDGS